MSEELVVVVSGGAPPDLRAISAVPLGVPVIAADRGLEHALALGLEVTVAVGDFDSASPEAVDVAEASGTRIDRHPAEKDATDLELALDVAAAMSPERILVLAGSGGRLDHELATLLLLASQRYADIQVDAVIGEAHVHVIRSARSLEGAPGELVTLRRTARSSRRCHDRGARVPASRRDARGRLDPRRLERLRGGDGERDGRARRAARDPPGR